MTNDVIKTRNGLILTTIVLGIVCIAAGMFFVSSLLPWILGVAIGVLMCVFRVFSMTKSIEKAVDMSPEDAKNYAKSQYMLRYIITFAVAVAACYMGFANPVGVIVGLVLLQPAVYIYNFIDKRTNKN
ncbi:MAG: ATP synthase subunit I [Clostridia bacterium]|nr:ATP synthase subunit I [Clostridia bacterium]